MPIPEFKIISTDNHLLLTTINNDSQKLKDYKKLSEKKQLNTNLLALDELFHLTPESKNAGFSFFYHNKLFTDRDINVTNYFALSADNKDFWFSTDKDLQFKINKLLKTFKVNSNGLIKISSLPDENLFNFILLMMAQSYPGDFSISKQVGPISGQMSEQIMFAPEQIVKIDKNYSFNDIRPYKKELDIEFLPQWQSGPFALATNQFKFDNSLVIEILAKGQNIHNLMEYSHSALLSINSVLNANNENILIQDCPKLTNAGDNSSDTYFRDTDGEQEAYVNDDFLSYQTITAKKEIQIQTGYKDTDINLIEGEIILQLPDQIMKKTIELQKNTAYSHFDNFSLFIKHIPEADALQYGVIGNTNNFITLRAYNDADEVINTHSLDRQTLMDKQINVYQQTFSEAIKTIKIFYTKGNTVKNYPFAFKPEILSGKGKTTAIVATQSSQPVSFSHDELVLAPLKEKVLNDNPAWLGQKWQGENSSQKINSPFYVNLFIHENSNTDNEKQGLSSVRENVLDAVLNIKSSQSPFISQNITAVKLTLLDGNTTLLDNFISFNNNELFEDGAKPKVIPYLNSNSAFELSRDFLSKEPGSQKVQAKHLHGYITLSLPNSFKSHSKKYTSLGQVIKLDGILIKTIQLNKHQIQFEIQGEIKNLVQLKLYNSNNNLISELFEFKHINKNKALLTLLYNDKINNIKLVLSQDSTIKEYPFSF